MKQPEALRLAVQLEREWINDALNYDTAQDAWTELRRLHALNQELVEALQLMLEQFTKVPSTLKDSEARCNAHAAIAKASGSATQTGETE